MTLFETSEIKLVTVGGDFLRFISLQLSLTAFGCGGGERDDVIIATDMVTSSSHGGARAIGRNSHVTDHNNFVRVRRRPAATAAGLRRKGDIEWTTLLEGRRRRMA